MKKNRKRIKEALSLKPALTALVLFYRKFISPIKPATCIYYPTCSQYMLDALKGYGALKGTALGIRRILRCVPWRKGGFDPVPDNPKGDMKWLF